MISYILRFALPKSVYDSKRKNHIATVSNGRSSVHFTVGNLCVQTHEHWIPATTTTTRFDLFLFLYCAKANRNTKQRPILRLFFRLFRRSSYFTTTVTFIFVSFHFHVILPWYIVFLKMRTLLHPYIDMIEADVIRKHFSVYCDVKEWRWRLTKTILMFRFVVRFLVLQFSLNVIVIIGWRLSVFNCWLWDIRS